MTDRILEKYTGRKGDDVEAVDHAAADEADADCGSFGWLRGIRDRAVMLELRKKDGNILAIGYGWLDRAEFDPSEGITLHITGRVIKITGRNLNAEARPHVRLFEGITRHRVTWVQEGDHEALVTAEGADLLVEKIEW